MTAIAKLDWAATGDQPDTTGQASRWTLPGDAVAARWIRTAASARPRPMRSPLTLTKRTPA